MDRNLFKLNKDEEEEVYQNMVNYRRHIHQNPEPSLQEFKTAEFIISNLKQFGFEEIYSGIAGTGVVAVIRGKLDESILIRADMDALKIVEATQLDFKSQNEGVMHACGHDGHVAMLLAAAHTIKQKVKGGIILNKGIKFCFQPAEENFNGAEKMLADITTYNILEASPKVTNCYAIHLTSGIPLGNIGYITGPVTANSERWSIDVIGKGGHAMAPEETTDALQIGAQIVNALYQIRGRSVCQTQPCTLSIGQFTSGTAPNVINDKAYICGSVRSLREEDRNAIFNRIKTICEGAQIQHECKVNFTYISGYKSVINDVSLKDLVLTCIKKVEGNFIETTFGLAGEDFYNFADSRPSAFVMVGAALPNSIINNKPLHPHHSNIFDFDEKAMMVGLKFWLSLVDELQVQ